MLFVNFLFVEFLPGCGRKVNYVKDNTSCGHYYDCDTSKRQACPGLLAFNPRYQICELPADIPECENYTSRPIIPGSRFLYTLK